MPNSPTASLCGLAASLVLTSCVSQPPIRAVSDTLVPKGPTIALVLGGGGAKGFAHIGVIQALEANDIHPNLIVGSSVGSFVGSLYASGKSGDELEALALTTTNSELTDVTLSYQGIIEGLKLRNFVNTQVSNRPIESFPIRFAAIATEKHSAKKTVFTQGEAGLIVQASSSVPNLFIAPRIPEKIGIKYVDGGVSSIVPVDAAKQLGADIVIAVDLQVSGGQYSPSKSAGTNPILSKTANAIKAKREGIWSLIDAVYAQYGNTRQQSSNDTAEVNRADVIIRPDLAHISTIDTSQRASAIAAGKLATEQNLAKIKAAIAKAEQNYRVRITH